MTKLGERMAEFPLEPQLSKILIESATTYKCVNEALTIVSMLNVPNVFIRPRDQQEASDSAKSKFSHPDGDHLTLLNAFNMFKLKEMNTDWCWNHYLNYRALKQANDIRD
mmetsp:Transcript_13251/g.9340  ORF Transcript_13251/g.9340 Transcript_13251/m.9340 type:complete len:110 (+) Transcript_13251:1717-2046(+)